MIVLAPYDPGWPSRFAAARDEIMAACDGLVIAVHHIGSTAIPGLAAKPVIDMLPVVRRVEDGLACVAPLQALGYAYRGEHGIAGRHYFVRGTPRSHQLHLFAADHREVERHLLFRDYLRAHPEERAAYERLKRELAERFRDDIQAYGWHPGCRGSTGHWAQRRPATAAAPSEAAPEEATAATAPRELQWSPLRQHRRRCRRVALDLAHRPSAMQAGLARLAVCQVIYLHCRGTLIYGHQA